MAMEANTSNDDEVREFEEPQMEEEVFEIDIAYLDSGLFHFIYIHFKDTRRTHKANEESLLIRNNISLESKIQRQIHKI